MGRRLRTDLDRLHPSYLPDNPTDSTSGTRGFNVGVQVYTQNYGGEPRWLPGHIIQITGPCFYRVKLHDRRTWQHHINQLRGRSTTSLQTHQGECELTNEETLNNGPTHPNKFIFPLVNAPPVYNSPGETGLSSEVELDALVPEQSQGVPQSEQQLPPLAEATPELHRSARTHQRPAYLDDYACTIKEEMGAKSSWL